MICQLSLLPWQQFVIFLRAPVINLINILENPILHYLVTNLVSQPSLDHLTQGTRTEDEHQVVDDAGPRQDDQEDQPEPDEHKDLLVDRVYWQHAESIVGLYCPWGSKLLINTFGHPGEHSAHGIKPVLRVVLDKTDHFQPVITELSPQEHVNKPDVQEDIDKCQELTKHHLCRPEVVSIDALDKVSW